MCRVVYCAEVGYDGLVTSKVDVYSYGVLLLELLTGKLPAHDASYGEALHVVAWVKQKVQLNEGNVSKSVLDPLFLDPTDSAATEVMLSMQEIALLCTQENPADRPSMRDVENMLNILSETTKAMNGDGVVKENLKEERVEIRSRSGSRKVATRMVRGTR